MATKLDRYEQLWRDYWAETHLPDKNGQFYFDRQDDGRNRLSEAWLREIKDEGKDRRSKP